MITLPNEPLFNLVLIDEPQVRFKFGSFQRPIIGLTSGKPYSYGLIRSIPVYLIFSPTESEVVDSMSQKLIQGYEGNSGKYPPFSDIFGATLTFEKKVTKGNKIEDYKTAMLEIADEVRQNKGVLWLFCEDSILEKEYLNLKSIGIREKIRTQMSKISIATKQPLEFTLLNLALGIYTKGGGLPWISEKPLIENGLFLGIGFSIDPASKKTFFATFEVFDKFGQHLSMSAACINLNVRYTLRKGCSSHIIHLLSYSKLL
ncbi:MAG: hypothetical protein QXU11_06300 [Thermoproteota archaeon]